MNIQDKIIKDVSSIQSELTKEQEQKRIELEKQRLEKEKNKIKEIDNIRQIICKDILEFHNLEYREYIDDYKRYIGDVSERAQYIQGWQVNASHPLVFMMVDTVFGTIFDFDYQLELKSKNLERACANAYDFMNKSKRAIGEAAKEALIIGKSIIRDYTYFEKGKYEAFGNSIDYNIKSPTMEYISAFNIMYDRMRGLNNSTYKIIRHFLTKEEILNKIEGILTPSVFNSKRKILEDKIKSLQEGQNNSFSYYNYEAIKGLLFSQIFQDRMLNATVRKPENKDKVKFTLNLNEEDKQENLTGEKCLESCKYNPIASLFLNDFKTKYEIVEYIEGNKKYFFINGDYIFDTEINPNIYNLTAFHYNEIPGSGKSVGISFILKHIVDASNTMLNMFFDSIKLGNTILFKQEGMGKTKTNIDIKNGMVLQGDIARINLGGNDFSGFNALQAMQNIAQSTLGISDMITGGDSRVQRIAGAFDFAFSQYKSRLTPFTDSIDMAMSKIVKGWICQYISLYSKEELQNLFGLNIEEVYEGEGKNSKLVNYLIDGVKMTDILNENNITFKFDSMFNLKKDALKKTAMDVFQLAQQYNNQKVDGVKLLKLLAGDDSIKLEEILGIAEEEKELNQLLQGEELDFLSLLNEQEGQEQEIPENLSSEPIVNEELSDISEIENEELIIDNLI